MKFYVSLFAVLGSLVLFSCQKEGKQELPFPETEEQLKESNDLTLQIDAAARPVIASYYEGADEGQVDVKALARELKEIDGVIASKVESDDVILLKQKDGVYINVMLDSFREDAASFHGPALPSSGSIRTRSEAVVNDVPSIVCGEGGSGKALMLVSTYSDDLDAFDAVYPEYDDYGKAMYDSWFNQLSACGYQVDSSLNQHVTIDKFFGSQLEQYDLILISAHGNHGITLADGKTKSTIIETCSLVSNFLAPVFPNLALCMRKTGTYYGVTAPFILAENPSLQDTGILMHVCYSYADDDLADAFYSCGASFVGGFTGSIGSCSGVIILNDMLKEIGWRKEVEVAYDTVKENTANLDGSPVNGLDIFRLEENPDYNGVPCYLFNPGPYSLTSQVASAIPLSYNLSWSMHPSLTKNRFKVVVDDDQVFVGQVPEVAGRYSFHYTPKTSGEHDWYVVSTLLDEYGMASESFRSGVGKIEIGPLLSLYPERIDFGRVGSADFDRRQKPFSIVNLGKEDVHIWVESCPEGFSTNIHEDTVVPAESTFSGLVTFSITEEKTYSGTVIIKSDVGTTLSLDLSGDGYYNGALAGFLIDELNFGEVQMGRVVTQTILVKNVGKNSGNLFKKDMKLSGADCFFVDMPDALSLGGGETCEIQVSFHPEKEGVFEAALSLTLDEMERYVTLPLRGTGSKNVATGTVIMLSTYGLNFEEVEIGKRKSRDVSLKNTGDYPVHILDVYCPHGFVDGTYDGFWIQPQETVTRPIFFVPDKEAHFFGNVVFETDAGEKIDLLFVNGYGIPPAQPSGPVLMLSNSEMDFGDVKVGQHQSRIIHLTNTGDAELHMQPSELPSFIRSTLNESPSLPSLRPGETMSVQFVFSPTEEKLYAGTLTLLSDSRYGNETIQFRGAGVAETVPVTSIALDKSHLVMLKGEVAKLKATISPSNASDRLTRWESSDHKVATVDTGGKVTAVSAGTATITVYAEGGHSASCTVEVKYELGGTHEGTREENWN